MYNLSILIPTHNRPRLFERAIESIYKHKPQMNIEVVVNNDTCDIDEHHSTIDTRYYYNKFDDISDTYKFLYQKARGEYIMYLEDDDYMVNGFSALRLDDKFSLHFIEYLPDVDILTDSDNTTYTNIVSINRELRDIRDTAEFISMFSNRYFQLSQLIIRNNGAIKFPQGNSICNDYILFQTLASTHNTIKYIPRPMWRQTTDGKDNISFTNLNYDTRFC